VIKRAINIDDQILVKFAQAMIDCFGDDMQKAVIALAYILIEKGSMPKQEILELITHANFKHIDGVVS
jgi:hypothetical protein